MSKTIIAVRHFGSGGRESLETDLKRLPFSDSDIYYKCRKPTLSNIMHI